MNIIKAIYENIKAQSTLSKVAFLVATASLIVSIMRTFT